MEKTNDRKAEEMENRHHTRKVKRDEDTKTLYTAETRDKERAPMDHIVY